MGPSRFYTGGKEWRYRMVNTTVATRAVARIRRFTQSIHLG